MIFFINMVCALKWGIVFIFAYCVPPMTIQWSKQLLHIQIINQIYAGRECVIRFMPMRRFTPLRHLQHFDENKRITATQTSNASSPLVLVSSSIKLILIKALRINYFQHVRYAVWITILIAIKKRFYANWTDKLDFETFIRFSANLWNRNYIGWQGKCLNKPLAFLCEVWVI